MVAERLATGDASVAGGWNFGPVKADERTVIEVSEALVKSLGEGELIVARNAPSLHEAGLLRLDCAKANQILGWQPVCEFSTTLRLTADWYGAWHRGEDIPELCRAQLATYIEQRKAHDER
jgi:CDP-glucose 4,6-dehydratase